MNNQVQGQSPRPYGYDDEISLVDLASMLVRRWMLMAAVFLIVLLGALAYALTTPRTYEYVTIYQVAEQAAPSDGNVIGMLETPQAVVAKINNLYVGPVTRELLASNRLDALPFDVAVSSVADTHLVRLASTAAADDSALVEETHDRVMNRVQQDQNQLLERRRDSLERELTSAKNSLESVKNSTGANTGELLALYSGRVSDIETRMSLLNEGQVNQMAVQSLKPVGTSRKLIMTVAVVLGGMLAVMAVFLVTFAGAVRKSLREE